jgi:hypothetical protein
MWIRVPWLKSNKPGPQAREIKARNFQDFGLTSLIVQYEEKPEKGVALI